MQERDAFFSKKGGKKMIFYAKMPFLRPSETKNEHRSARNKRLLNKSKRQKI